MWWKTLGIVAVVLVLGVGGWYWASQQTGTGTKTSGTGTQEGWVYAGDFPVSAVDITIFRMPDDRFVAYYVGGTPGVYDFKRPGRAFSTDGLTWTEDADWDCTDLCLTTTPGKPTLPHRKHLVLNDGRVRTYVKSESDGGIVSYISSDGLTWEKEDGLRFALEPAMLKADTLELGQNFTPVYTNDGQVRAYYEVQGEKPAGFTTGQCCRVLASAISSDDGLTFTKEDGVRVNAADFDQVLPSGVYNTNDPTVIATEGGYRIFFGSAGLSMSAFSKDGLTFTFDAANKGYLPLGGTDPSPLILPDGRLMVVDGGQQTKGSDSCDATEFPDGCPENYDLSRIVVWDTLPYTVSATKWDTMSHQTTVSVAGPAGKSVTVRAFDTLGNCKQDPASPVQEPTCNFDRDFFTVTPATGQLPFESVVAWSATHAAETGTRENVALLATEIDGQTSITIVPCVDVSPAYAANGCKQ
ncbi:hypothetical protein HY374_02885 [Candidatus Berkelbacteria bacterium]|nr:hypothetical protein [Candidatus Berkelbacteria bacterium]